MNSTTQYIELTSIGHYFDKKNNCLYPINADNSPDLESEVLVSEVEKENGISNKDWDIIHDQ
jgi:hypothetical protein